MNTHLEFTTGVCTLVSLFGLAWLDFFKMQVLNRKAKFIDRLLLLLFNFFPPKWRALCNNNTKKTIKMKKEIKKKKKQNDTRSVWQKKRTNARPNSDPKQTLEIKRRKRKSPISLYCAFKWFLMHYTKQVFLLLRIWSSNWQYGFGRATDSTDLVEQLTVRIWSSYWSLR